MTRIEDLSSFFHKDDPEVEAFFKKANLPDLPSEDETPPEENQDLDIAFESQTSPVEEQENYQEESQIDSQIEPQFEFQNDPQRVHLLETGDFRVLAGRISSKKLFGMLGILGLVGGVAVGILMAIPAKTLHNTPGLHRFETWQNRVSGFFEKEEVPAAKFDIDKDAQIAHARIAIATSHVVGKGPGNSIQRDFLSQAFSDFIFAIVIEEMGLVGGIFVVFLYLWLLMRAGRIAQKCERTFPAFLVMGIALLLVSQAILNMMVAVGLFPVTGQPLPLVSKGGTSTLINCAYIGMILSVSRYTAHLEEQKAHDAQIQLQIEADAAANSEAQAAAEPTAQILNSDAKFEDEHDSKNNER
jgi:cell division protein FtsW